MEGEANFKLRINSLSSNRYRQRFRIRVAVVDDRLLAFEPGLSVVTHPMKCVTKLAYRGTGVAVRTGQTAAASQSAAEDPYTSMPSTPLDVMANAALASAGDGPRSFQTRDQRRSGTNPEASCAASDLQSGAGTDVSLALPAAKRMRRSSAEGGVAPPVDDLPPTPARSVEEMARLKKDIESEMIALRQGLVQLLGVCNAGLSTAKAAA